MLATCPELLPDSAPARNLNPRSLDHEPDMRTTAPPNLAHAENPDDDDDDYDDDDAVVEFSLSCITAISVHL